MNHGIFERANTIPIERVTRAISAIDTNHSQIHAGNAYSIGGTVTIAAGATSDITVSVPDGVYVHYQASDISTDGGNIVSATLYEGSVITPATGTVITPVNRRRIGEPVASLITIKKDPTITTIGQELDRWYFPKAADKGVMASISKSDTNEWVLRQNCTYTLRISNIGATTAAVVSYRPFWYEEEDA